MKTLYFLASVFLFIFYACIDTAENDTIGEETTHEHSVYLVGSYGEKAAYWCNNEFYYLPSDGAVYSSAKKIIKREEGIYIFGNLYFDGQEISVYWLNNELHYLTLNLELEDSYQLKNIGDYYVENGNIYVCGYVKKMNNSSLNYLVYWKNGEMNVVASHSRFFL